MLSRAQEPVPAAEMDSIKLAQGTELARHNNSALDSWPAPKSNSQTETCPVSRRSFAVQGQYSSSLIPLKEVREEQETANHVLLACRCFCVLTVVRKKGERKNVPIHSSLFRKILTIC